MPKFNPTRSKRDVSNSASLTVTFRFQTERELNDFTAEAYRLNKKKGAFAYECVQYAMSQLDGRRTVVPLDPDDEPDEA